VLAPIDSGTVPSGGYPAIALAASGSYECSSQGVQNAPPITPEPFSQAVTSSDCPATLKALDGAWAGTGGGEIGPPYDFGVAPDLASGPADLGTTTDAAMVRPGVATTDGCSVAIGAGPPSSVGILLALVAALVYRRARQAQSADAQK
jgi:MYXO-CTERM domain-containing protein